MKPLFIAGALALSVSNVAMAAEQTWRGKISDKACGGEHKVTSDKMSDRDCISACTNGGAAYALIVNGKVYQLTGHDSDLKMHAGHTVNLTGELKGDAIRVSKVEMPTS